MQSNNIANKYCQKKKRVLVKEKLEGHKVTTNYHNRRRKTKKQKTNLKKDM